MKHCKEYIETIKARIEDLRKKHETLSEENDKLKSLAKDIKEKVYNKLDNMEI